MWKPRGPLAIKHSGVLFNNLTSAGSYIGPFRVLDDSATVLSFPTCLDPFGGGGV